MHRSSGFPAAGVGSSGQEWAERPWGASGDGWATEAWWDGWVCRTSVRLAVLRDFVHGHARADPQAEAQEAHRAGWEASPGREGARGSS